MILTVALPVRALTSGAYMASARAAGMLNWPAVRARTNTVWWCSPESSENRLRWSVRRWRRQAHRLHIGAREVAPLEEQWLARGD
jgi:hypothetical protein